MSRKHYSAVCSFFNYSVNSHSIYYHIRRIFLLKQTSHSVPQACLEPEILLLQPIAGIAGICPNAWLPQYIADMLIDGPNVDGKYL